MSIGAPRRVTAVKTNLLLRNRSEVVEDLRARNFTPGDEKCVAALGNSTSGKYMALMRHLLVIGQKHMSMVKLFLPPAEVLKEVDFESVKPRYLDNTGQVLDWRDLETRVLNARSLMEEDTLWADGEKTPDPTTLDDLNRRMLGIEDVPPVEDIEELSREALTPPDVDQQFYELVQRKSPLRYFGKTITVGTIKSPASGLTRSEQELVIDALNFTGRSREDMRRHVIEVEEVPVVFYKGKPIAFGAGIEIGLQNNGSTDRLEYLIATKVRDGFYERGLQTVVNDAYLSKRKKFMRKSPFVLARTASVGPIAGFFKYFAKVAYRFLNPAQERRRDEFARFIGCSCDEQGIVRNAYQAPPQDPRRDQEILKSLEKESPRDYDRVVTALKDLGPLDAIIIQGVFTYWGKLKGKIFVNIVFRLKNWIRERREEKTPHSG